MAGEKESTAVEDVGSVVVEHIKIYTPSRFDKLIKVMHEYGFTEKPDRPHILQYTHGGHGKGYIGVEEYAQRELFEFWPEPMWTHNDNPDRRWNEPTVIPATNFDLAHYNLFFNYTWNAPKSMILVHGKSLLKFTQAVSEGEGPFLEALRHLGEVITMIEDRIVGPGLKRENLERMF